MSSILDEGSTPTIFGRWGGITVVLSWPLVDSCFQVAIMIATSAVPVATSKTRLPGINSSELTSARRQASSEPRDMTLFTMS